MAEFEVNGATYSVTRMDAFTQLACLRRVAPLLSGATSIISGLPVNSDGKPVVENLTELLTKSGPLLDAIARLRDEDVQYVIEKCLAITSRKHAGGFSPVWVQGAGFMFELSMPEMLQVCARVLQDSVGPFSFGLASKSPGLAA